MPIRTWRRACPRSQNPSTIKARPQAQPRKNHHRPAWSPVITDFSASTPNPPATAPPAAIAAEPSSTAAQRPPARSVDRPEPTTVSRGVAGCSWCVTTTVHLRQPTPPSGARWDHPMCLMLLVLNPVRQRERPTRGCAPRHRGVTAIRSTGSGTRPSLVPLRGSSERVRGTDDQLSTDHAPILWFFDVPPAGHQPAPTSLRHGGSCIRQVRCPPFTPRKPLRSVDHQRQALITPWRRLCSLTPNCDDQLQARDHHGR